MKFEIGEVLDK